MRLAILAILCASGCYAAPDHWAMVYDVRISPAFTTADTDAALVAVDRWRAAVPGLTLRVSISNCEDHSRYVCLQPDTNGLPRQAGMTDHVSGETGSLCHIFVNRIAEAAAQGYDVAELTRQTAEHELGHALMGAEHLPRGNLMASFVEDQAAELTPADLAHFAAVR